MDRDEMGFLDVLFVCLIIILLPIGYFVYGWLIGSVLKLVFGSKIIYALNLLFDTNRFTVEAIPYICALFYLIAGLWTNSGVKDKGENEE